MKLNEIKDITQHEVILEGTTPIHIIMILNEISKAGKCSNAVQYNVLLQLVELFRYGRHYSTRYLNEFTTSKARLDELKALKPEDQVALAHWAMDRIVEQDYYENSPRESAALDLQAWILYVLRKQK
jgi:hypothetical protein